MEETNEGAVVSEEMEAKIQAIFERIESFTQQVKNLCVCISTNLLLFLGLDFGVYIDRLMFQFCSKTSNATQKSGILTLVNLSYLLNNLKCE